jgi:hypothetical protein
MEAGEGKRVRISFVCKLEDGSIYDMAIRDNLEFVIGQGHTLPALERGVLGMKPGEHRTIRVPGSEVEEFPFDDHGARTEPRPTAGAGGARKFAYQFGPGEGGDDDVYLTVPASPGKPLCRRPADGSDIFFEVALISVEEPT